MYLRGTLPHNIVNDGVVLAFSFPATGYQNDTIVWHGSQNIVSKQAFFME